MARNPEATFAAEPAARTITYREADGTYTVYTRDGHSIPCQWEADADHVAELASRRMDGTVPLGGLEQYQAEDR